LNLPHTPKLFIHVVLSHKDFPPFFSPCLSQICVRLGCQTSEVHVSYCWTLASMLPTSFMTLVNPLSWILTLAIMVEINSWMFWSNGNHQPKKGRRVCAPLGTNITTMPQGVHAHTHGYLFSKIIVSSLCSLSIPSWNIPKEKEHLIGVSGGLTSSPNKLFVVPRNFVPLVIHTDLYQTPESCPRIPIRTHTSSNFSLHRDCPYS
jgi:hypothetical protein